jgi:hypothetical protein
MNICTSLHVHRHITSRKSTHHEQGSSVHELRYIVSHRYVSHAHSTLRKRLTKGSFREVSTLSPYPWATSVTATPAAAAAATVPSGVWIGTAAVARAASYISPTAVTKFEQLGETWERLG